MPPTKQNLGERVRTWTAPVTAILILIGAWFSQKAAVHRMEEIVQGIDVKLDAHVTQMEIHSTDEHHRLLVMSETKDMRSTLHDIRRGQDVVLVKLENLEKQVKEIKDDIGGN